MKKQEWDLIKQYIDAKINFEIDSREEDEDGYRGEYANRKEVDQVEKDIETYFDEIFKPLKIRK